MNFVFGKAITINCENCNNCIYVMKLVYREDYYNGKFSMVAQHHKQIQFKRPFSHASTHIYLTTGNNDKCQFV